MPGKYPKVQPKTVPPIPQFQVQPSLSPPATPPVQPDPPDVAAPKVALIVTQNDGFNNWNISSVFDGVPLERTFGAFDCLFMCQFARAAYGTTDEIRDLLTAQLDKAVYRRVSRTVNDLVCVWDEYAVGGRRLVAIPGTSKFTQWLYYGLPQMELDTTLPHSWYMYKGVRPWLLAYDAAISAEYAQQITAAQPFMTMTGHSLGGAIAHFVSESRNKRIFSGGNTYNAFIASYSFGAPAFWYSDEEQPDFGFKHRSVRTTNPGDPVVDATTNATRALVTVMNPSEPAAKRVPQHYTRFSWTIDQRPPPQRTFWQSLDDLRKGKTDADDKAFSPHSIRAYAENLELTCRNNGATPYPDFTYAVTAHHMMTAAGG